MARVTRITVDLPDNVGDPHVKVGRIIQAALNAGGKILAERTDGSIERRPPQRPTAAAIAGELAPPEPVDPPWVKALVDDLHDLCESEQLREHVDSEPAELVELIRAELERRAVELHAFKIGEAGGS